MPATIRASISILSPRDCIRFPEPINNDTMASTASSISTVSVIIGRTAAMPAGAIFCTGSNGFSINGALSAGFSSSGAFSFSCRILSGAQARSVTGTNLEALQLFRSTQTLACRLFLQLVHSSHSQFSTQGCPGKTSGGGQRGIAYPPLPPPGVGGWGGGAGGLIFTFV